MGCVSARRKRAWVCRCLISIDQLRFDVWKTWTSKWPLPLPCPLRLLLDLLKWCGTAGNQSAAALGEAEQKH